VTTPWVSFATFTWKGWSSPLTSRRNSLYVKLISLTTAVFLALNW